MFYTNCYIHIYFNVFGGHRVIHDDIQSCYLVSSKSALPFCNLFFFERFLLNIYVKWSKVVFKK